MAISLHDADMVNFYDNENNFVIELFYYYDAKVYYHIFQK